jgi:hypothetical protein
MPKYYKSTAAVWNNPNSWSAISSVSIDNAGIPSQAEDVIFDATSGIACAVTSSVGTCRNLTTTGYIGIITLNTDLQVFGPTIIVANTTFLGAGWFTIGGQNPAVAKTMNSNGVFFPNFQLGFLGPPVNTITFNDVLNVGNIRQAVSNGITTNGSSVSVNNSMIMEASGYSWQGTTVYNLVGNGNGNFGMVSTSPSFQNKININKTGGTITFLTYVYFVNATFTYIAGNVVTTGNTLLLNFTNTITSKNVNTSNEILFNKVQAGYTGSLGTTTLNSDMRVLDNFTVSQFNGYNFNGNTIFVNGNIINPSTIANGGTSVMVMEGPANATISGGNLTRSLTISKSGGATVTLLDNLTYGVVGASKTLTINTPFDVISNSTTITAGGTPLTIINSYGSQFFNLTITATTTLNIN